MEWEPLDLRLLAWRLQQRRDLAAEPVVWHLRSVGDVEAWLAACRRDPPALVAFAEIDVLVGRVCELAARVKELVPGVVTAVGGKQTSLLRVGDLFPFRKVDYAIAGCGSRPLVELARAVAAGERPERLPGRVVAGGQGRVVELVQPAERDPLTDIDPVGFRSLSLVGPSFAEYCLDLQRFPAPVPAPVRTATLLWSSGCAHSCDFCQSPMEAGAGFGAARRPLPDIVREIVWLAEQRGVNALFALAANLDLADAADVLEGVRAAGVPRLPLAGFVRAADVVAARDAGLLARLAELGVGVLSVGFDTCLVSAGDPLGKGFDRGVSLACLEACREAGIPVSVTLFGDTLLPESEFRRVLATAMELPVLGVDIRLATTFRNTPYYLKNRRYLLNDPAYDPAALDYNDYRHQTLQAGTGIRPEQLVRAVADFRHAFRRHPARADYARELTGRRPETAPLFGG